MFLPNLTSTLTEFSSNLLEKPQILAEDVNQFVDSAEQEHPNITCTAFGVVGGLLAFLLFCLLFTCIRRCHRRQRRRRHVLTYEGFLTPIPPASKRTGLRINSGHRKKGNQGQLQDDTTAIFRGIKFSNNDGEQQQQQNTQSDSTAIIQPPHPKNNPFEGEGDSAQSGDEEEIVLA